jgi:D-threonate/D-erythronate kinase
VFAPALPAQGRYTLGGRLALAPPGGSAAQAEPRGESLREALLSGPWPTDCELVLPEVRSDDDLSRLTGLLDEPGPRTLWCGSAGLAAAVARHRGLDDAGPTEAARPDGPLWVVGASHQPVTRRQWARAVAAFPSALTVRDGDAAGFTHALAALSAGDIKLALLDLSPPTPMAPEEAAALLHAQATRLAALPGGPARLLVLGGDTARALAGATGVTHLVSGRPLRPGWGQAGWRGGRWQGLWMDCRSGAFGDDDDLRAAVSAAVQRRPTM